MSTEQAGIDEYQDAIPDEPWRYECPIHGRRVRIRGIAAHCDGDERWGSHSTLLVRDTREGEIVRTDGVTLHGAVGGSE